MWAEASEDEAKRAKKARTDSLAVFTYHSSVMAFCFPTTARSSATHAAALAFFYQNSSLFSVTRFDNGVFFLVDAKFADQFSATSSYEDVWRCIYLHDSSTAFHGAESTGTLAAISQKLANANVCVLNMTTMDRNFMIVPQHQFTRALRELRKIIGVETEPHEVELNAPMRAVPHTRPLLSATLTLDLLQTRVTICSLSTDILRTCTHSLLWLIFLRSKTQFLHVFHLGGEICLMFEEDALHSYVEEFPSSGTILVDAVRSSLSAGWRAMAVSNECGAQSVGVLSRVCEPLSSLPLMNVSTLEVNFLLVPETNLEKACLLLRGSGATVKEKNRF